MEKYEDLKIPSWGYLIIGIGSYFGASFIANLTIIILKLVLNEGFIEQNATSISITVQCVAYLIVLAVLSIIFKDRLKPLFERITIKNTWTWAAIGFAILWGGNYLYNYFLSAFEIESSSANQESLIEMVKVNPGLSGLYICILAPVVEEIVFRLGIFRYLEKKNKWLALIVTSLIFAFMHMISSLSAGTFIDDIYSIPSYLIGAFGLTYTYMKSKSLASSVAVHIANNTLSFIAIILLSSLA